jgi:hypothetical protein
MSKVLAIIVSDGDYTAQAECLAKQTVKPAKTLFATESFPEYQFAGERVGRAIREAFTTVDLQNYTHIFRIDDDVIIAHNHLEQSLAVDADLVGTGGYAMLINTRSFLSIFKEYPIDPCEDSVVAHAMYDLGYKIARVPCKVKFIKPMKYPPSFWFRIGIFRRMIRYSPVSLLLCFRDKNGGNLMGINVVYVWLGYVYALFHRIGCYWFIKERSGWKRLITAIKKRLK